MQNGCANAVCSTPDIRITRVRIDSTVTETHILEPSDSQLLYDAVRVLSRLLARGRKELGPGAFPFHDHRRAAKRGKWKIPKARTKRKVKLYRELLAVVRRMLRYADAALAAVEGREEPWLRRWRAEVANYRDLAGQVVGQTVRRVLNGETVPAEEKVVSLFEFHTDIIRKGGRRVQVRTQGEPGQRCERPGVRCRGRGGQSGGQLALSADDRTARRDLRVDAGAGGV